MLIQAGNGLRSIQHLLKLGENAHLVEEHFNIKIVLDVVNITSKHYLQILQLEA